MGRASRPYAAAASTSGSPSTNGDALLGHLGMSGQMLLHEPGAPDERHLRVRFVLAGRRRRAASRCASSTSGCSAACSSPTGEPSCPPRSPTSPATRSTRSSTTPSSCAACAAVQSGIKRLLLDQGLVSGVGNIYADEALWRPGSTASARVTGSPPRRSRDVLGHVRDVMAEALAQGGTSFDALYVNVNGESGYFDRSLDAYGREGEPCGRCGTPIRRVAFMNRSSYFCPQVPAPAPPQGRRDADGVDPACHGGTLVDGPIRATLLPKGCSPWPRR